MEEKRDRIRESQLPVQPALRQRIRRALLIISFLLLPISLFYLCPFLMTMGAMEGVITGSMVLVLLLFIASLFVSRLWCGWLCPTGGFQELCSGINNRPVKGGIWNYLKYGAFAIWIVSLLAVIALAGGLTKVDLFHNTKNGISVSEPVFFIPYFVVVGMLFLLVAFAGRRANCHYLCPTAVVMITGRKIRNLFRWPALHLEAEKVRCAGCKKCSEGCPMGLDVNGMVRQGTMESPECILCGTCIDICPENVIRYAWTNTVLRGKS
jgi:ferredoxin-type protein NapH